MVSNNSASYQVFKVYRGLEVGVHSAFSPGHLSDFAESQRDFDGLSTKWYRSHDGFLIKRPWQCESVSVSKVDHTWACGHVFPVVVATTIFTV